MFKNLAAIPKTSLGFAKISWCVLRGGTTYFGRAVSTGTTLQSLRGAALILSSGEIPKQERSWQGKRVPEAQTALDLSIVRTVIPKYDTRAREIAEREVLGGADIQRAHFATTWHPA
jgi:hypothetical protein